MNKTITIIIIIIAITGAVLLGYFALSNKPDAATTANVNSQSTTTILPYGSSLDFQPIKTFNSSNRFFPYPKVTTPEIGSNSSDLVP